MTRNRFGDVGFVARCGAAARVAACAVPAAAQTNVTSTTFSGCRTRCTRRAATSPGCAARDSDLAARLQTELDDLRDEVVYLKVKMRKEGSVSRADYTDVRDRLQDLRDPCTSTGTTCGDRSSDQTNSARHGGAPTAERRRRAARSGIRQRRCGRRRIGDGGDRSIGTTAHDRSGHAQRASAIPVGQELDVRLETELRSDTAQVEQRFEATTVADLYRGNDVLIPAGSTLRGVVSSVDKATRTIARAA